MVIEFSNRLKKLPSYFFAQLDQLKNEYIKSGKKLYNFGVGDPDLPTWDYIIEKLSFYIRNRKYHQYPSYEGAYEFKAIIVEYFKKRFNIEVESNNIITLIGSKEGIAHFPLAFINKGDSVFVPEPGYPVYRDGTYFANGEVIFMPLLEENNFLPDIKYFLKTHKPKIVWVNYPNNPTSVNANNDFYKELIELAHKYNFIIASDAAYLELYQKSKTHSILEFDGAIDVAIEFHSFSKIFNMTGWRIGFAVGNSMLIKGLGTVKKSIDSGVPTAIQMAARDGMKKYIDELNNRDGFMVELRKIYKKRREVVSKFLPSLGLEPIDSEYTFYIWSKIIDNKTDIQKVEELLKNYGILASPGSGFGPSGKNFIRFSLTIDDSDIIKLSKKLL